MRTIAHLNDFNGTKLERVQVSWLICNSLYALKKRGRGHCSVVHIVVSVCGLTCEEILKLDCRAESRQSGWVKLETQNASSNKSYNKSSAFNIHPGLTFCSFNPSTNSGPPILRSVLSLRAGVLLKFWVFPAKRLRLETEKTHKIYKSKLNWKKKKRLREETPVQRQATNTIKELSWKTNMTCQVKQSSKHVSMTYLPVENAKITVIVF